MYTHIYRHVHVHAREDTCKWYNWTYDVQMELSGGQWRNNFIGYIFKLHHVHKCEVVVWKSRHNVLLKATDGRQVTSIL